MANTNESRVSESSDQQNHTNNDIFVSPPLSPFLDLGAGRPTEVFVANGSSGASLEDLDVTNEKTETFEKTSDEDDSPGRIIVEIVEPYEDVIKSLIPLAEEEDVFIVSASGKLSYVEVLNQLENPVTQTAFHGNLSIVFMDGRIVHPNRADKNHKTETTVLVTKGGDQLLGGPVRSIISKTRVQIVLSTKSRNDLMNMAIEECGEGKEIGPLPDMEEVGNQIYKDTLKELNPSTS